MNTYTITLPDGRKVQVGAETYDEAWWLAPAVADANDLDLAHVYGEAAQAS
jgi:hypothetical protein